MNKEISIIDHIVNKKNKVIIHSGFIQNYSHMIKHTVWDYINLSRVVEWLRYTNNNNTKKEFVENLIHIYRYCDNSGFIVTKNKLNIEFTEIINDLDKMQDTDKLDDNLVLKIVKAIQKSDEFLILESQTKSLFEAYNGRLDCNDLIENQSKFITVEGKNYMNSLSIVGQYDFTNACLCIAYGLWTSAGFHLSRLIEEITYDYALILGVKDAKKTDSDGSRIYNTMRKILGQIKTKTKNKKYKAVFVSELDAIRDLIRNSTQHPDKIYTQQEAEGLFYRAISIITAM